ncbi:MAG: CPBP family intramembrane metalloprotease [Lysobacterales bacterium]|nr:MAG: CPBP family intramembrane metalloprotease [Xanthomonadales bacterium]
MHASSSHVRNMSTRPRELAAMAFVSLLLLSYIWIWRRSFPGAATLFAVVLLATLTAGHVLRRGSLRDVGFRLDTFARASMLLGPVAAVAIVSAVLIGHLSGSARFPPASTAVPGIAEAVVFGLAQQYLLLGFFYRRLEEALQKPASSLLGAAAVFALFHLPNPFLTAVTFFAGLVAAWVYRRAPNLWVNGVIHGLVSYCLYFSLSAELTGGLRVGPGYWAP